mmetsp:Transcript_1061/g.6748  ORF Transcript_1061/g.6748 Transcript_1061/m.6748 type:complete len:525 (-) Transcript_1061:1039-2613(-)
MPFAVKAAFLQLSTCAWYTCLLGPSMRQLPLHIPRRKNGKLIGICGTSRGTVFVPLPVHSQHSPAKIEPSPKLFRRAIHLVCEDGCQQGHCGVRCLLCASIRDDLTRRGDFLRKESPRACSCVGIPASLGATVRAFVRSCATASLLPPVSHSFERATTSALDETFRPCSFLPALQVCISPIPHGGFFLGGTTVRARTSSFPSTHWRRYPTRRFVRLGLLVAGAGARRRTWTCGRASSRHGRRPWLVGVSMDRMAGRLGTIQWILVDGLGRARRPWKRPLPHKRPLRRRTRRLHACAWRRVRRSRSVRRAHPSRPRLAAAPGRTRARGNAARERTWPQARPFRRRPAATRLLLPRPRARVSLRFASLRPGSRNEARLVRLVASRNVWCTARSRRLPCAPRHADARASLARHVGRSVARWRGRTRPIAAASTHVRSATTRVDARGDVAWPGRDVTRRMGNRATCTRRMDERSQRRETQNRSACNARRAHGRTETRRRWDRHTEKGHNPPVLQQQIPCSTHQGGGVG